MRKRVKDFHQAEAYRRRLNIAMVQLRELGQTLRKLLHRERYSATGGVSEVLFNSFRYWAVSLSLEPEADVAFMKKCNPVQEHFLYQRIERFPGKKVTGRLLYVERHEREHLRYYLVLDRVKGAAQRTKFFIDVDSVLVVVSLRLGDQRQNKPETYSGFVRTLERFGSEKVTLGIKTKKNIHGG